MTDATAATTAVAAPEPFSTGSARLLQTLYLTWLPVVAVVVGSVLRVRNFVHKPSFWLDEFPVVQDLAGRGYGGLTKPLDGDQAAPVGWLWAEKLAVQIFGVNEYGARVVPLVASLVALIAFPRLARWTAGRWVVPVATVLFALAPALLFYSVDTKPYSSDVTCTILVLLATIHVLDHGPSWRSMTVWGVIASGLAWFSFPAVVVGALCGVLLFARFVRDLRTFAVVATGGAILLVNIAWQYLVTLRRLSHDTVLDQYWRNYGGYPPRPAHGGDYLRWLRVAGSHLLADPFHLSTGWLALLVSVAGIAVLAQRRWEGAVLMCLPPLIGVALAITSHYPLATRLALFIVPSALLFIAAGAVGIATVAARSIRSIPIRIVRVAVAAVVLVLIAGSAARQSFDRLAHPDEVTASREAIQFVAQHRQDGDVVLIEHPWAFLAAEYYGPRLHVPFAGSFNFAPKCGVDPLAGIAGRRVWLVFAHKASNLPADRSDAYVRRLEQGGTLVESYSGAGSAGAYLIDLGRPQANPPPEKPGFGTGQCLLITMGGVPS